MSALASEYGTLLSETKPEVIDGEDQHQHFVEVLERLTSQEALTPAQEKLVALLILLITEFENRNYPMQPSGPLDVIRHIMEVQNLRQKDLVDVFGTESIVSDVLNGRRELRKEHIQKLSARFGISPAAFF